MTYFWHPLRSVSHALREASKPGNGQANPTDQPACHPASRQPGDSPAQTKLSPDMQRKNTSTSCPSARPVQNAAKNRSSQCANTFVFILLRSKSNNDLNSGYRILETPLSPFYFFFSSFDAPPPQIATPFSVSGAHGFGLRCHGFPRKQTRQTDSRREIPLYKRFQTGLAQAKRPFFHSHPVGVEWRKHFQESAASGSAPPLSSQEYIALLCGYCQPYLTPYYNRTEVYVSAPCLSCDCDRKRVGNCVALPRTV